MQVLGKITTIFLVYALAYYFYLFQNFQMSIEIFLVCTVSGFLYWTFHEYIAHRFVLHPPIDYLRGHEIFKYIHWNHHEEPENFGIIAVPLPISLFLSSLVFLAFWGITGHLDYALAAMPPVLIGYLAYEWVHFWVHYTKPKNRLGKWYRKWHFIHHFQDEKRCYGVTSPLWDIIFRTT